MYSSIIELFPEINWIKDAKLREQVISIFENGIKENGWTLDKVGSIPFTASKPTSICFRDHIRGVTGIAAVTVDKYLEILDDKALINRDYVVAGALLHDVGKLMEMTFDENGKAIKTANGKLLRHAFTGAGMAMKQGLPDEVVHIIAVHSSEGEARGNHRSRNAEIVAKADNIMEILSTYGGR